jgi:formylglycine-generating enzyme required for sulfatase activity
MNLAWVMGVAGWLACGAGWAGEWVEIPRHSTRAGEAGGYELGKFEVAVAEFAEFLNGAGADFPDTAQIARHPRRGYAARRGMRRQAVSEVTPDEAEAYCAWRSREEGRTVRLPTEAEWEVAARGGVDGAPYPWGWGGKPSKLAQFDADGPARREGRFLANGFGLHDMAGNLYEWCAAARVLPRGKRIARGGSWAERDPALLEVTHRQPFWANYRGRDVGFRVLREAAKEP